MSSRAAEVNLGYLRRVSKHANVRWVSEWDDTLCWQTHQHLGRSEEIGRGRNMITTAWWTGPTLDSDPASAGLRVSVQRTSCNDHAWPPAEARQRERHDAIAGWTATDSAPTSVGLRVSVEEPAIRTASDPLPSLWRTWEWQDHVILQANPFSNQTDPAPQCEKCGSDWTYTRHLFSVGLGRTKTPSLNLPIISH